MNTLNPRVLMIEALIDGELNPPEKADAESEIESGAVLPFNELHLAAHGREVQHTVG